MPDPIPPRLQMGCASLLLSLALSPPALADTLYKCRTPKGGVLYSDHPCEEQKSRQIKTLEADRGPARSVPPAPAGGSPAAAAARPDDPDGVLPQPVVSERAPALEAVQKSAGGAASWWSQLQGRVNAWFNPQGGSPHP